MQSEHTASLPTPERPRPETLLLLYWRLVPQTAGSLEGAISDAVRDLRCTREEIYRAVTRLVWLGLIEFSVREAMFLLTADGERHVDWWLRQPKLVRYSAPPRSVLDPLTT